MDNVRAHEIGKLIKSKAISEKAKVRMYKTVIVPMVMYGCKAWAPTKKRENSFRFFENRILRRIF